MRWLYLTVNVVFAAIIMIFVVQNLGWSRWPSLASTFARRSPSLRS
jgi:hypothetical protein